MNDVDFRYVRPAKAEQIRLYREAFKEKDELQVVTLEDGIVLPLKANPERKLLFGSGGCVTAQGEYVELSGIKDRIEGDYEITELERSDKKAIYCGYMIDHWGHFLIEAVTRLWYALENGDDYDEFVFFTQYGKDLVLKDNFKAFFELLKIDDKVVIVNKPTQYKQLAVPETAYTRTCSYSKRYKKIFETVRLNALAGQEKPTAYPEKIFLSRSGFFAHAKNTQEFGLDMLDNYFAKNGYAILYPERLSLVEVISYIHHAKICASESGSCAHNFLFAAEDKQIEIVERQGYVNEIQANLDMVIGCPVTYIDAYCCFYPVDAAGGPYLLFYTKWFEQFCKDRDQLPPDERFLSETFKEKAYRWYKRAYYRRYGRKLFLHEDVLRYSRVFSEAMEETYAVFSLYLDPLHPKLKYVVNHVFIGLFGWSTYDKLKKVVKERCRK